MANTHLQSNANTSPRKRSRRGLRYVLNDQVDYRLDRQNGPGEATHSLRNPRRLNKSRLSFLYQHLHVRLPLARVFQLGCHVISIRNGLFRSLCLENVCQGLYIRADKLCIILLKPVVSGVPQFLGCGKRRTLMLCGLCCGLQPFGSGLDRRDVCLHIVAWRGFRGLFNGGYRSWMARLFTACVGASCCLNISSGRRFRWSICCIAEGFSDGFYILPLGRLDVCYSL